MDSYRTLMIITVARGESIARADEVRADQLRQIDLVQQLLHARRQTQPRIRSCRHGVSSGYC